MSYQNITSYYTLEHWQRSALYKCFSNCKGNFPISRQISSKSFMEMRSAFIVWFGVPLLALGRGLHSMDKFKTVMVTSLALDASLVKFS